MKCNAENMGWFGLTWEEKLAKSTYDKVQAINKTTAKKLKDFLQAGSFNIRLIQNMYREYAALMAKNYKPANFNADGTPDNSTINLSTIIKNKLNVDETIVLNFLLSIQQLAAAGTIPFSKWNPSGYAESTALQKKFDTEKSFLDKAQGAAVKASNVGTILLVVAGLGFISYVVYETKRR